MKRLMMASGITVLAAFTALAQDSGSETPKFEASVDYSFAHFDPARNLLPTRNINGGGGSFVVNFGDWVGVKGDLQGYGSNTFSFTLQPGVTLPNGAVTTQTTVIKTQGNLFTYTFGPVIKKHTGKFQPFGEVLLGAAHSNTFGNLFRAAGITSKSPNNNGFAMVVGGGIDFKLSPMITFRPVEADYLLTRFGSNYQPPAGSGFPSISTQNQNSFRYLAGVDFTFGGK